MFLPADCISNSKKLLKINNIKNPILPGKY